VAKGLSALWNKIPEYETVIELVNDAGEVIGRRSVRLRAGWQTGFRNGGVTSGWNETATGVRFTGVNVNKITDRLSIRIASLNGKSAEEVAKANGVSIVTRDEYWRTVAQRDLAFYRGDNDRALADYTQAIRFNPRAANAYYNRGLTYYNKYNYGRAEEDFAQAVRLGLNNARVKELQAKVYFARNYEFRNGVIIKYTGKDENIVIPEQINGTPVRAIENQAFYRSGRDILRLSSVVVPDTVTVIGLQAFIVSFTRRFTMGRSTYIETYTTGLSLSLPANIGFKSDSGGYREREPLAQFYDENGQKAGTYICIWDGKADRWWYEAKR
jgi:tetratricopeptide (TPR) repeat protein